MINSRNVFETVIGVRKCLVSAAYLFLPTYKFYVSYRLYLIVFYDISTPFATITVHKNLDKQML